MNLKMNNNKETIDNMGKKIICSQRILNTDYFNQCLGNCGYD